MSVSAGIGIQDNVFLWTDSTIVLHWVSATPPTWQTFVANRVAEIQELTVNCSWNHVPGEENFADLISRGMDVVPLINSSLWWNGPPWLASPGMPWPKTPEEFGRVKESDLEARRGTALPIAACEDGEISVQFSSFVAFLRVSALCRRFAMNCRSLALRRKHPNQQPSESYRYGRITVDEINAAMSSIVGRVQEQYFAKEIAALQAGTTLPNHSPLRFLSPELQAGLIRVGGRLKHSAIPADARHSLLLLKGHPLTRSIAESMHWQ